MMQKLNAQAKGTTTRVLATLAATLATLLAFSAATASAEEHYLFSIGGPGQTAGKFAEPSGLSTNDATGNIYVADRQNNRIQELGPDGEFILAWGYDVVQSGEDDKPKVDEVQRIQINNTIGGTYTLTYQGQTTAPLAYNASASTIEAALNGLASINSGGGSVSVSGTGPYVVTFDGGPLKETDQPSITADPDQFVHSVGATLNCESTALYTRYEGTTKYQWLADGQPISGATEPEYTTQASDAGKAIQCQVELTYENAKPYPKSWDVNPNYHLVGPMATPPPEPPANIEAPTGPEIESGGTGGETETCHAGAWGNSPTEYTYQWYMHNGPLGPSVTTAATSNDITLTESDVAERSLLQCKVTATNAGGSVPMWSDIKETSPGPPFGGLYSFEEASPRVDTINTGKIVGTSHNGGLQFEVCKAAPSTDVCKAGAEGSGFGQMSQPRGVAVDNSPGGNGDVWVGDDHNNRVEKFTADGTPILEIGGDVNETTGNDVCTAASGDDCGRGEKSVDPRTGRFGGWPIGERYLTGGEELGNTVAVDPNDGQLFVTSPFDTWFIPLPESRIQRFDSQGNFLGFASSPKFAGPPEPTSVDVDRESHVLVTRQTDGGGALDVFSESEFTPEGTQRGWAERTQIDPDSNPRHVSHDPSSDKIWVVDRNATDFDFTGQNEVCAEGITESYYRALIAYDHEGHILDCTTPTGLGRLRRSGGLTVTDAGRAYVSEWESNVIKVYSLPQEEEPEVGQPSVDDITTGSVKVFGTVNPGFEPTEYSIEYGTSPCSTSTCQSVNAPGKVYGLKFVPVNEVINNLDPGTKYYYRVVATNPLGTVPGPERTFTTYPFIDLKNDPCENVLARKQTRTAGALDCRAYELASAGFTGGYDVVSDLAPGQTPLEGFPEAPGKVLYSVRDGGIPGTGFPTNRGPDPYVAVRGANGWSTQYVGIPSNGTPSTAPFSSRPSDAGSLLDTFAFGGSDICSPCFEDGSSGIPVHMPDGSLVQGMTGSEPEPKPAATQAGYIGDQMSKNGHHLVFGTTSKLEPAATEGGDVKIYDRDLTGGTTQVVSTMPGGELITGAGIGELAISRSGDRIVVGQKVGPPDAKGNSYWHLYMHIGSSANSVDLTPGTTSGVLFLGMSDDGNRVFYATKDALSGSGDGDNSVDVYEAEVPGSGAVTPQLISVGSGGAVNDDTCTPTGYPDSWNSIAGDGKCNAVGFAGGAGVAADGTVYFLSPELLAGGGEGEAGQANLYVARPGDGSPTFVATIDSGAGTTQPAPKHVAVNNDLIAGLSAPFTLAVDQNTGDIYVGDEGAGKVKRFTSAGAPDNFSELGKNEVNGTFCCGGAGQIAVDSSGGVMNGNLYVPDLGEEVHVFASTGKELGALKGIGETPCGVAVDQISGDLFVATFGGRIWRFGPTSAPSPGITNANYSVTSMTTESPSNHCQLAAGGGDVYVSGFPNGPLVKFSASQFNAGGELREGTVISAAGAIPPSHAMYVDPASGELHVTTGSEIVIFDGSGNVVKKYGSGGQLSGYGAIAVNGGAKPGQAAKAGHSYSVNGNKIVEFAPTPDTYEPIDDPAIVHAVDDSEVHDWSDFQTSANGDFALFSSQQKVDPTYDNSGFREVYQYDAAGKTVHCASCLSTEGVPTSNAGLPTRGLGITNDGRAFFNSGEPLVMRDQNGNLDAYEWSPQLDESMPNGIPGGCKVATGCQSLISTGISNAPSSLLTTTNNGVDAFFFTRETLVSADNNGDAMKIYDARAQGGFFELPASPPCAASDECHGPGSAAAPPPPIGTHEGTGGNAKPHCEKGFHRKHGKCVRKRKHHEHHRRAGHGKGGSQ